MEKKSVEVSTSTEKSPIVYLRGMGREDTDVWYRIDIESLRLSSVIDTTKPKTECSKCFAMTIRPDPEPLQLSPFIRTENPSQLGGSWTIDGDHDIYYIEGGGYDRPSRNLLKVSSKNLSSGWETISSSRNFFGVTPPFIALIGRKLYVLGGDRDHYRENESNDENGERESENSWGEVFDLDSKTWEMIELDISSILSDFFSYVVMEKEGEDTRIVLFPCHNEGKLMFYNVSTSELIIEDHPSFHALLGRNIRWEVRPVVDNSTFYWFTYDLYLNGYDVIEKRWFQSRCLKRELWTIPESNWLRENEMPSPPTILVGLCKGKFLLISPRCGGKFALAILDVVKEKDCLNVSVDSLHTLLLDDKSFWPDDAMMQLV